MGRPVIIVLLLTVMHADAQQMTGKVVDALTNKPLGYSTVMYSHQNKIVYTDSIGNFNINLDSLDEKDTIYIQYVGYKKLAFPVKSLGSASIFKMVEESQELGPVVVTNCPNLKQYTVNKRVGRIGEYIGPGPETKFVILGRYLAGKDVYGYVKQLEIYAGNFNVNIHVPVRLHWYAWDSVNNMPGKELTSANIVVYPYQHGWNIFALQANAIYFSGGIVIGLEFIYPVEYMQQYSALATVDEKASWLMNMNNRWSLGIQITKDAGQAGFYQVNNLAIKKYNSRGRNLYIKPAVRFTVVKCMD